MQVRVLSWNVFLRPPGVQQDGGDLKDVRIEFIMRKIVQYDVVLLQEMFAIGSSRLQRLLTFANDHGLAYHAGPVYPSLWSRQLVDGGALILSRYPIRRSKTHQFHEGCGSDALAAKGVVFAQIQLGSPEQLLDVFTTHTQAGEREVATAIRWRQLEELAWFVHTNRSPSTPAIVGGDFNLDARHNVEFADHATPVSTKCKESEGYRRLVQLLSTGSSAGEVTNVLASAHDVTNANGHGVLTHSWPKAQVDQVGKCIDYLFLLHENLPNGDSTSRIVYAAMDHCAIDSCDTPHEPAGAWPVTHLSDHWAITATFDLPTDGDVAPVQRPVGQSPLSHSSWSNSWWPYKATAVVVVVSSGMIAIIAGLVHLGLASLAPIIIK